MITSLIVAADEQNGIGNQNRLLCYLPGDLKYFKTTTTGHHILMGRRTYESVGKPLPNRVNIVISGSKELMLDGCIVCSSVEDGIDYASTQNEEELFITGGGNIYKQTLANANRVYLTRIHHTFEADTHFPELNPEEWKLVSSEHHSKDDKNLFDYSFLVYERIS